MAHGTAYLWQKRTVCGSYSIAAIGSTAHCLAATSEGGQQQQPHGDGDSDNIKRPSWPYTPRGMIRKEVGV